MHMCLQLLAACPAGAQNISPQMLEMMSSMDFNQEKVNEQFQQLGLKPEDVVSKVRITGSAAAVGALMCVLCRLQSSRAACACT